MALMNPPMGTLPSLDSKGFSYHELKIAHLQMHWYIRNSDCAFLIPIDA